MTLQQYAKAELERAGLFDKEADYNGAIGRAVMELIDTFVGQGHSGTSAAATVQIFAKVAMYTPLDDAVTDDPDDWEDRSAMNGSPLWQYRRDPAVFSRDGGQTWYDINNPQRGKGDVFEQIAPEDFHATVDDITKDVR